MIKKIQLILFLCSGIFYDCKNHYITKEPSYFQSQEGYLLVLERDYFELNCCGGVIPDYRYFSSGTLVPGKKLLQPLFKEPDRNNIVVKMLRATSGNVGHHLLISRGSLDQMQELIATNSKDTLIKWSIKQTYLMEEIDTILPAGAILWIRLNSESNYTKIDLSGFSESDEVFFNTARLIQHKQFKRDIIQMCFTDKDSLVVELEKGPVKMWRINKSVGASIYSRLGYWYQLPCPILKLDKN